MFELIDLITIVQFLYFNTSFTLTNKNDSLSFMKIFMKQRITQTDKNFFIYCSNPKYLLTLGSYNWVDDAREKTTGLSFNIS